MADFEIVFWEQRRIAIKVTADNAKAARDEAEAIWDCSSEEDMETLPDFTVDNHDIKSTQVYAIVDGQGTEVHDE
jgi:hypothetical protein